MDMYTVLVSLGFFALLIVLRTTAKTEENTVSSKTETSRPAFKNQTDMLQRSAAVLRSAGWTQEQRAPKPKEFVEDVVPDLRQQAILLWKENCQQVDAMFHRRTA